MKRSSSRSVKEGAITNGAKVSSIASRTIRGRRHNGPKAINQTNRARRSNRANEYPLGTIGSDLEQRNYIRYLVERYHRARRAELDFGRGGPARFSYAAIFTNIERKFGAPTYFVSKARFQDLGKYLQHRIDATVLGKSNITRGIANYMSPEEFEAAQLEPDQQS
jgi:hypothetical protein